MLLNWLYKGLVFYVVENTPSLARRKNKSKLFREIVGVTKSHERKKYRMKK